MIDFSSVITQLRLAHREAEQRISLLSDGQSKSLQCSPIEMSDYVISNIVRKSCIDGHCAKKSVAVILYVNMTKVRARFCGA